ncbi:isocitrate lyase/PEP mutase family protein [Mucilaginibacter celer]|uniref:Isocitrate lyase/phosphoenolpyruvate mutase family protein n=1 Tax=Mucilaginibacter celer TaxID=2305508 RepID=A0A494VRA6_9SPHI|nr:isocitrate lyase/phosphoenolpyruvate mutase family protein [Mucilaginibacter celer]AYL98127.1 isocitrate lyase/phosphoenolpyruvate mutase family protein [Mucilaginibacter celer]
MNQFEKFKQLHQQSSPLLLGNIWDVQSAKIFEAAGYQAVGTSSQAVAIANGYDDGEQFPFDILVSLAKRVVETVNIPFSTDIEGGYSRNVNDIITNIEKLADVGVAGINIEDTVAGSARTLQPADDFAKTISAIANHLSRNNIKLFLNIRTDGFLLGLPNALDETLGRIKHYENAGASGIFTPCITTPADITAAVNATTLPVNVMCMPQLPGFDELANLGVKRISMGGFLFSKLYEDAGKAATQIFNDKGFGSLFS